MRQGIVDITANCSCITAIQTSVILSDSISLSQQRIMCVRHESWFWARELGESEMYMLYTNTLSLSHISIYICEHKKFVTEYSEAVCV
jgi:hypothetical protein